MATKRQNDDLRPPSLALLALELRAPWEFGALLPAWPVLARAPAGDGHSIIIFPGLSASDATTDAVNAPDLPSSGVADAKLNAESPRAR